MPPKGMCADVLRESGTVNGHFDSLVDNAGINVMAAGDTRTRVYGQIPGGEHILPAPFRGGGGILPSQTGISGYLTPLIVSGKFPSLK